MATELTLRIIVERPPKGVDYGVQSGHGAVYEVSQKQRSKGADLTFEFTVAVKGTTRGSLPALAGPFVQGPAAARFVYLDIGTYAGQAGSCWSRKLKVPLTGITREMIDGGQVLEARVPGTGRDGGPACAGVRDFDGWAFARRPHRPAADR